EQFIDAVTARMARLNRLQPVDSEIARQQRIGENRAQLLGHLVTASCNEIIATRSEQILGVLPGGAHQRYPAGQRLEHANRRDSRERIAIGTSWHMYRRAMAGE